MQQAKKHHQQMLYKELELDLNDICGSRELIALLVAISLWHVHFTALSFEIDEGNAHVLPTEIPSEMPVFLTLFRGCF